VTVTVRVGVDILGDVVFLKEEDMGNYLGKVVVSWWRGYGMDGCC
jgi:hypothetical protein